MNAIFFIAFGYNSRGRKRTGSKINYVRASLLRTLNCVNARRISRIQTFDVIPKPVNLISVLIFILWVS